MKTNRISLIAAMALGGLLACSPVTKAADTTNAAPATPPAADAKPKRDGKGGGPYMGVIKSLDLNEEQKQQVQDLMKGQREKMQAMQQDTTLSRQEKMAKRKELMDGVKEDMKKILTPEQYTKFETGIKNMGPAGRRPGAAAGGPAPATPATPPPAPSN